MQIDTLIKNGHVIDPARGIDGIRAVGIRGNRIIEIKEQDVSATLVIDASGCYVFPGLIDFHAHLFHGGTIMSINPDFLLCTGVTAAVDAGSSGCATYLAFHQSVIVQSWVRIKTYLSCFTGGMVGAGFPENFDPALFDKAKIAQLVEEYEDNILGLKLRLSLCNNMSKDIKPLEAAIALAEDIGSISVCVHVTNPPCAMTDIVNLLRKDDVLCHVFHRTGDTLFDKNVKIPAAFRKARERGVIFDMAHGRTNFSHKVCQDALRESFLPDILSTDMTEDTLFSLNQARSLPFVMSQFLSYGISLTEVVRATTQTPARLMKMEGQIGTLAPGALADVAIFKMTDRKVMYLDKDREKHFGNGLLVPQATISNGLLAFAQIDFNLPSQ
ncbi:metallo-dependent hydrolase [Betaproteobacteria bacterium]|nr:metallo-dependent hydrolase [Betaproteobacteria bacterium]